LYRSSRRRHLPSPLLRDDSAVPRAILDTHDRSIHCQRGIHRLIGEGICRPRVGKRTGVGYGPAMGTASDDSVYAREDDLPARSSRGGPLHGSSWSGTVCAGLSGQTTTVITCRRSRRVLLRRGRACSEVRRLLPHDAVLTLGGVDQTFDHDGSIPGSCRVCLEVPPQIVEGWK
jgi:hypothetical protein